MERNSILLVDDDDDLRRIYGSILRREGYHVREAENGEDALRQLEQMNGEPCLVLLDLMMPVMNGAALLKILHASGCLASMPVVVLSAGGQPSDAPEATQFVRKPVDGNILISLVRDFCGSGT